MTLRLALFDCDGTLVDGQAGVVHAMEAAFAELALPAPDGDAAATRSYEAPQGEREETLARIWAALLGVAKVGCVGYCLGGRLAYMTAARTDIDASVGYYGVGIDGLLGEKHAIAHPLMLHIPTNDGFVPRETQAAMHAGLDDHPKVTLHDYDGLDHGFATEHGKRAASSG